MEWMFASFLCHYMCVSVCVSVWAQLFFAYSRFICPFRFRTLTTWIGWFLLASSIPRNVVRERVLRYKSKWKTENSSVEASAKMRFRIVMNWRMWMKEIQIWRIDVKREKKSISNYKWIRWIFRKTTLNLVQLKDWTFYISLALCDYIMWAHQQRHTRVSILFVLYVTSTPNRQTLWYLSRRRFGGDKSQTSIGNGWVSISLSAVQINHWNLAHDLEILINKCHAISK